MQLYTRPELIPAGKNATFLLWPLLGISEENETDPDYGRFENYLREGKEIHQLVSNAADADAFVLPFEFDPAPGSRAIAQAFAEEAQEAGKPLIVFYNSDFSDTIDLPGAVVFRTTALRSKRSASEHGFPGWSVDFLKYSEGKFTPLKKTERPKISYCGYIDYRDFSELFRYVVNKGQKEKMYRAGPELRGAAVRKLKAETRIDTDFILRNGFWASGITDKNEARRVYAQNMIASPYALVARGAGNFSYRLYEVLSCGRIPVFIDTDCLLPLDEFIDWKNELIWIDEKDKDRIAGILLDRHASFSPGDFEEKQQRARQLYENWIRPEAFFKQVSLYFRSVK